MKRRFLSLLCCVTDSINTINTSFEQQGRRYRLVQRAGTYPETFTLITPVTLRTPRDQVARIGG